MNSNDLGKSFEIITKDYFTWLLEKIGFIIIKERIQFSGTQDGFDISIIVVKDFEEQRIWIECKNYSNDLKIGEIIKKAFDLEKSYKLNNRDLFIAINSKSNFSNQDNPEKSSEILDEKFKFKCLLIDLSNGVKELFALNSSFYKEIYGNEVEFDLDEDRQLNKFQNIIFSRKPFKKTVIHETDKLKFIGDLKKKENYITRRYTEDRGDNQYYYWFDDEVESSLTLQNILEKEDRIFVLGNPGIGKTTELENFTIANWKEGEVSGYVPIFKSLRDFTNTDSIEEYLPSGWKEIGRILLILDGIDEIVDIEYFKSKLNNFFNNYDSNKYKCIISCRTNVYESIVRDIHGFKKYYLKDLSRNQSIQLLKAKCGLIIDNLVLDERIIDFLKTPFQVEILADFINQNSKLPSNTSQLWQSYVESRLSHDKIDKLKKLSLNTPLLKNFSRKMSLVNELMKSNVINEDNLFLLTNQNVNEFNEFKKNPLIEKQMNSENYFFEHRNIQEYFAAVSLKSLKYDEIKNFILIEGTNITHPSLFNTITFLINLLDSEKFEMLIEDLINNEPELLFKADKNRISSFRVKLFQDYFKRECIEKTFWISNKNVFTINEIADFGNCRENFDFLHMIINDYGNHYRVIISALELLSFFSIPSSKKNKFKEDLIKLLKSESISDQIKAHALNCINDLILCKDDKKYLLEIFRIFKDETSKEINVELLSLLVDQNNVDEFFWYIKNEFLRDKRAIPRKVVDEVIRGNSWKLEKLILKLESSSNFIFFAKYYFDEVNNTNNDNRFAEDIIEKCLFFENNETDFLVRLLSSFEEKENYYIRENLLKKLILKSNINSQIESFTYLINNYSFNNVGFFLASIANEYTIDIIIDNFKYGTIDKVNLEYFRNVIANHGNRKLASRFNKVMLESGFIFKTPFIEEYEFEIQKKVWEQKPQNNFNKLFNKKELLSDISLVFIENGNVLTSQSVREISNKWYEKNGHHCKIDIAYSILRRLIKYKNDEITLALVNKRLQDEIIIEEIKSILEGNDNISIDEQQRLYLSQWCKEESQKIRFDQITKKIDDSRFILLPDYEKLKLILFFIKNHDIVLSKDFMLKSLEFFDIDKSDFEEDTLNELRKKINNDKLFNEKIIYNILNKTLISFALNKHIEYALKNNLALAYPKIREYFFIDGLIYNSDKRLNEYFEKTNDLELLLELCNDVKKHHCWSAIKILMRLKIEPGLCQEKVIEYLKLEIDNDKRYYYSNALGVLFELNSIKALEFLYNFIHSQYSPSLNENSYSNFDAIESYNILEELFNLVYLGDRDKIGFSGLSNFLKTYISNLSRKKSGFEKTISKLNEIKDKIIDPYNDNSLFYINFLIDESRSSYINSKSRALSFEEALPKVEEILG